MALVVNTLEPAHSVVRILGGCRAVGRALKLNSSTVSRWCTGVEDGGTNGRIPQKHWSALIQFGQLTGVRLTVEQLSGLSNN